MGSIGNLVKILHGTKGELLLDVVWHPVRPIIASVSSGVVSIWAQNQVENWSAFAPDFKELDENVEYEERESEFDIADEDRSVTQSERGEIEDDLDVDVTTVQPIHAYYSSDEEKDDEEQSPRSEGKQLTQKEKNEKLRYRPARRPNRRSASTG